MGRKIITDQQIAEAEKAARQATARLQDLKAQKTATLRAEKTKLENRRKILLGAWCFSMVQTDADFKTLAFTGLDKFLTRDIDRAAFPELIKARD